jgi:hypothetical protein
MRMFVRAAVRVILIALCLEIVLYAWRNIVYVVTVFPRMTAEDYWPQILIIIGAAIIGFIILALLWWRTDWLVRLLTGRVYDRELVISTSNVNLMKVAMRIVGIILLVNAIPSLLGLIGYHFSIPSIYLDDRRPAEIQEGIIIGVKIILGIFLVYGTKGMSKIIDAADDKIHVIKSEEKPE